MTQVGNDKKILNKIAVKVFMYVRVVNFASEMGKGKYSGMLNSTCECDRNNRFVA